MSVWKDAVMAWRAAVLGLLVVTAACGGDTDTTSPANAPAPTTAAPAQTTAPSSTAVPATTTTPASATTAAQTTTASEPTSTTAAPTTTAPTTTASPTTTAAPTTTAPTTTAPTTTGPPGPVVVSGQKLAWTGPCADAGLDGTYGRTDTTLTWTFATQPTLGSMEVRTRPAESSTGDLGSALTGGFGLVNWRRHAIPVHEARSYEVVLPRPIGNRIALDVDLVVDQPDGPTCVMPLFTKLVHAEADEDERRLSVPAGIVLDRSRYADLTLPEPTVEALVHAFAEYRGPNGMGDDEPDYEAWRVWDGKVIRDYDAELRHFLFGDALDLGDWEAAALMLEVLAALHPDLDPRFATTIDEVNLPQFHPLCERWILDGDWMGDADPRSDQQPCQRSRNGAYFSEASTQEWYGYPDWRRSRGFLYHNSWVVDADDLTREDAWPDWPLGGTVNNPCCSINFHEASHAMGLEHNYCAYSAVSRWDGLPYMTAPWSADDLAGMAIHLDPRTTHGMDIRQAADALGIPRDARFDELVANPWRACGRQDPAWTAFADLIFARHVSSANLGTNHPDDRTPILYDR